MSLDEHYLFSEPFPQRMGSTDQAIAAEEVASGLLVVIHLLAGGNCSANQEQLKIARALPPASVRFLREIGEHKGTPFVVTEPLPNQMAFRVWLGQVAGRPMPTPVQETEPRLVASDPDMSRFRKQVWKVPTVPPVVDQAKPGEFTQMFRAPEEPAPSPPPASAGPGELTQMLQAHGSPAPQPTASFPAAAPPAQPSTPGEFTQLLRAGSMESAVRPVVPSATAPAPPAAPGPGEFTQLLHAGSMESAVRPVAPAASGPVTPAPPALSEFTQLLQAGSMETAVRPAAPAKPAEAAPAADDEFMRMLQNPPAPPAGAAPAPLVAPPEEYDRTRLFSAPVTPAPQPLQAPAPLDFGNAPAPVPAAKRTESPLTSAQPGEFTRMLQSPMAPTPQAPLFSPATEPVADRTPGGFTQLFESPFSSPNPPPQTPAPAPSFPNAHKPPPASPMYPATPGARDQNEFDRLFNEPNAPPVRGNSTNVFASQQGGAPAPPAQQGPSEYTLMFKSPPQPAVAPAPAAPMAPRPAAPAAAAKPAGNYMLLIYVLGGLLVVALAIVIYLLVKK